MKKIGLIGGMSWESSLLYYQYLNESIRKTLGGFHSAHCILESVDFAPIENAMRQKDWAFIKKELLDAVQQLEKAGAECIVLCTNTMHRFKEEIEKTATVPFLHIADATGKAIRAQNINRVLLLGTQFTMEQDFFTSFLKQKHGIDSLLPNGEDRKSIHRVIFEELVHGEVNNDSKSLYLKIITKAQENGAQGVILGCTEIPLLINATDVTLPLFDTTKLHAQAAVEFALSS